MYSIRYTEFVNGKSLHYEIKNLTYEQAMLTLEFLSDPKAINLITWTIYDQLNRITNTGRNR